MIYYRICLILLMSSLIFQSNAKSKDTKVESFNHPNDKEAEVTKVGFYKKRFLGGYGMILPMNSSFSSENNHELSSSITYENSFHNAQIRTVNLRGRLSDKNLKIPIKLTIHNLKDEGTEYSKPLFEETLYAMENSSNEDIISIDLTDYGIELPKNGVLIKMEILGLRDHKMNDEKGIIVLQTGRKVTEKPRSFLNYRPFKTRPLKKGNHKYYNIGCWLEVES